MILDQWYAVLSSKEVRKGRLYGTTRLGNAADRIILHQDRRVVLTQRPKKSELVMGENLVQGDAPIIAFRQRREELKRENQ